MSRYQHAPTLPLESFRARRNLRWLRSRLVFFVVRLFQSVGIGSAGNTAHHRPQPYMTMVTVRERSIKSRTYCVASLVVLAFSLPLLAAGPTIPADADKNFDGNTITRIVFYPAQQPYPEAELLKLLPLKTGSVFHEQQLPGDSGAVAPPAASRTSPSMGLPLRAA